MAITTGTPGTDDGADLDFRIASAIADEYGIDVTDVDCRLYDVLDADGMRKLFARHEESGGNHDLSVSFTMAGCDVVVTGIRDVDVTRSSSSKHE